MSKVRASDRQAMETQKTSYIIHLNLYGRYLLIREPDVWVVASARAVDLGGLIDLKREIERRKGI